MNHATSRYRRGRTFWETTRQLAAFAIRRGGQLSPQAVRNEWATRRMRITGPTPSDPSRPDFRGRDRQQRRSSHSRLHPKASPSTRQTLAWTSMPGFRVLRAATRGSLPPLDPASLKLYSGGWSSGSANRAVGELTQNRAARFHLNFVPRHLRIVTVRLQVGLCQ